MTIRKFFFPFTNKYTQLANYAWHRFAIVIYWLIIGVSLIGTYFVLMANQTSLLDNCYRLHIALNPQNGIQTMESSCSAWNTTPGPNLIAAVVGTLVLSYIIQILYYKIILYIIFGRNSKQTFQ